MSDKVCNLLAEFRQSVQDWAAHLWDLIEVIKDTF